MQRDGQQDIIVNPSRLSLLGPKSNQYTQYGRVHVTPYYDPRDVEHDTDELDTNGRESKVDHPGTKSLLVENSTRDEEPRIDLNGHARTHQPMRVLVLVRQAEVD